MAKFFSLILLFIMPFWAFAQNITGQITDIFNEPLVGASVYWAEINEGTNTDSLGYFSLEKQDPAPKRLAISYVGFASDTLIITDQTDVSIQLMWAESEEVILTAEKKGVIISDIDPIKTEQITTAELGKAACCDLAGCFETQTTVQPQTTNVITNSKELRVLGLSGVYTQVLIDGFPIIQGLTYTYGISSVPGTMVDNIYVAKGANSVLQGFESISGQINVETKEPDDTDKLYLNTFINNFGEKHLNGNYAFQKGKWSNLTSLHTIFPASKFDRDGDNFLDLPQINRYRVSNKTKYGNENQKGWHSRFAINYFNENRAGGQINFDKNKDLGSNTIYGQSVNISQPEIWTKTGYRFNNKHHLVFFASSFIQNQDSYFGTLHYDADQTNLYSNAQYELNYNGNNLKTGFSYRYMQLNENIDFTSNELQRTYDGLYEKDEHIAGVFAENTLYFLDNKLSWMTGLRADNHNQFGIQITPRTLLKYNATPSTVIRANVGTGWRTVNLFSENINLLVSSRDIVFQEELKPEKALNYGINITQKFNADKISGYLTVDFYRTDFQNQIFPDYDSDPTKAIIANFDDESVSNNFQAELNLSFLKRFEFKSGYSFLDVYRVKEGVKEVLPFNPRHKVLTTFSYKPISKKFHIDLNGHWYGKQRLPNTDSNPVEFQRPDFSKSFAVANAQFTYIFKRIEVYTGCENIFDFRQLRPIISWENPFSKYFDTSSVWGPTRGREFYLGARYKL